MRQAADTGDRSADNKSGIWKHLHHQAHSVELRLELLAEVHRAKSIGIRVPRGYERRILRFPSRHETFVKLLRFLNPRERILLIDVGGNTGFWCEQFLEMFPETQVVAFEPVGRAYTQYRERLGGRSNVRVHNTALSDAQTSAEIAVGADLGRSSFHEHAEGQDPLGVTFIGTERVQVDRLDSFELPDLSRQKVVLKVDVQGHESQVLAGAARVLEGVDVSIVECSIAEQYARLPPSLADVCQQLLRASLHPAISIDFGRHLGPYAWEQDFVFVRQELLKGIFGW